MARFGLLTRPCGRPYTSGMEEAGGLIAARGEFTYRGKRKILSFERMLHRRREAASLRSSQWLDELCALPQLFTKNATKCFFDRLSAFFDVLVECLVDHSLITASPPILNGVSKPFKDFIVDANGYTGFPGRRCNHSAPLALAEVVFFLHRCSPYCARSRAVAFLAEMIRMLSPRHV